MEKVIPDEFEDLKEQATPLATELVAAINNARAPFGVVVMALSYVSADVVCQKDLIDDIPDFSNIFFQMFMSRAKNNLESLMTKKGENQNTKKD